MPWVEANLALRPRGRLARRRERGLEGQFVICRPGRCWRGGGRCAISEVARQRWSIRQRRHSRASSSSSTHRQQQHYSQRHRGQSIRSSSVNASLPIQTTVQQRYAPSNFRRLQQRQRHLLYPSTPDNHHRRVFLSPPSASHSSHRTDTLLVTIPSSSSPVEPAPDSLRRRPQHTSRQSSPSTPSLSRGLRNRTPPSSSPTSSRSAYHRLSLQPALSSSRQVVTPS